MGSVCFVSNGQIHMDYRNPGEKRDSTAALQVRERAQTPTWTGFYRFSRYSTSRMVLIYYAQDPLGGYILQKTKDRMLLITSKRNDICKCKGESG